MKILFLKDEELKSLAGGRVLPPPGPVLVDIYNPAGKLITQFDQSTPTAKDTALLNAANRNDRGLTAVIGGGPLLD